MKKLIILGCYSETNWNKIEWHNYDYEIWGVASCLFMYPSPIRRLDAVFEIHRRDEYIQDTYKEIYNTEIPVYLQKKDNKVYNQRIFPYDEIFEKHGYYFTNSLSLMLVYAVMQGYKDISFYGVNMETDRESTIERPNIEYWIGKFQGQGIDIRVDCDSRLLKSVHVYGIDNILAHINQVNKKTKMIERRKKDIIKKMILKASKSRTSKDFNDSFEEAYKQLYKFDCILQSLEWQLREI